MLLPYKMVPDFEHVKMVFRHVACESDTTFIQHEESFLKLCKFFVECPEYLSKKGQKYKFRDGKIVNLESLAKYYLDQYRKSDYPKMPTTVPDNMVDVVMQLVFDHAENHDLHKIRRFELLFVMHLNEQLDPLYSNPEALNDKYFHLSELF